MALSALALAAAFALQPVGSFHGGEAVARDGERWLALRGGADATLVVATARVRRVHDEIVDAPDARTGEAVSSTVAGTRMLLRGAGLRPGAVATAWQGDEPARISEAPIDLRLGDAAYRLALRCALPGAPCRVELETGTHRQALLELAATRNEDGSLMLGDDASPALLFAGDIDRDGRLDLILDATDHYNLSRPTLYLSTQAADGELVHRVAEHEAVGC